MKVLVAVATYNEIDNIQNLLQKIHEYLPEAYCLIVDDASPDGTGVLLDKLKLKDKQPRNHSPKR